MGKKVKKEAEPPPKDVFDPLNIESKKTGTVVLMLKSEEEEVLAKACEAVYKFADKCDDNKLQLLELGGVEALKRLISHDDKMVKRYACMAFGVIAANAEVRKYLRKTDSIATAIQLLGDEDDVCNEFSSLFLAHMSTDFTSKLNIYKNDGLEPLINLLASPDPDVQKNSVDAISNLVQDFQSRAAVRELGGIPSLLDLLKSDYAIIQELTLTTLSAVTQDSESRNVMRENEGIEAILEFLSNKDYTDLHVNAMHVLANCLEDTEVLDDVRNSGGVERLLAFATESTNHDVQASTATAIARVARNVENAKILHEQEVEKTLITLTTSTNESVQITACQAIASMANNLAAKDMFGKSEGSIPAIVGLMQSDTPLVKEAATLAISNLTLNHLNNCNEIVLNGGVEVLLSLLDFEKEAVVVNAITILNNMAQSDSIRTDIQKRGIIANLTVPLKSQSSKVQSKAAQAVALYVTGADSRSDIRQHGALDHLVNHLQSRDSVVRRDSSWAILTCSADAPTASAIANLGAIEILQQINASEQRRNNFSIAALDKLLDGNLPAKYALSGRLEAHNLIKDGFFDAGQLREDQKFVPLDELAKSEVNQKRPILLVNCKAAEPDEETLGLELDDDDDTEAGTESSDLKSARDISPKNYFHRENSTQSLKTVAEENSEKGSKVGVKPSHTKRSRKKDKEAVQREEAERLQLEKEESIYRPPIDQILNGYYGDVNKYICPMSTNQEQIVALAQYVAEKLGGEIERDKLSEFSWELHLSELKFELQSNIIPIGKIQRGIHYHRALLFKALADSIGVPASLVRGSYNRAWNEVLISMEPEGNYPPVKYVVDLMFEVGRFLRADSPEAAKYQSI